MPHHFLLYTAVYIAIGGAIVCAATTRQDLEGFGRSIGKPDILKEADARSAWVIPIAAFVASLFWPVLLLFVLHDIICLFIGNDDDDDFGGHYE